MHDESKFLKVQFCKIIMYKINNLLLAVTFFISSQIANESLVNLVVEIIIASKLLRNLEKF